MLSVNDVQCKKRALMQYADSDGPDQSVYLHSQIMASGTRLIKTHNTENYKDAERMH